MVHRFFLLLLATTAAWSVTASVRAADVCPNAPFRTGAGANLPDCRAWEQVSPVRKNSLNAEEFVPVFPVGDRVLFTARGPLEESEGSPLYANYLASRGSSWSTQGVDPPFDPVFIALNTTLDVSDDLSTAIVTSTRRLAPGGVDGDSNVYRRNLVDGSYQFTFRSPGTTLFEELSNGEGHVIAQDTDARRFALFSERVKLTPDAPEPGNGKILYEWDGAGLRLASVLPDGTPTALRGGGGARGLPRDQAPMSQDGRRLTFEFRLAPDGDSATYQRVAGRTTLLSRSHRTGGDTSRPVPTLGVRPTPDGERVTFLTAATEPPLTDDTPVAGGSRLYRWRASDGELEDLLAGVTSAPEAEVNVLNHQSGDGRFVWFTSGIALTPDAVDDFSSKQYVLDTDARRLSLVPGSVASWSPNGRRAVLVTTQPLTGFDSDSPACSAFGDGTPGPCAEVFTYDALEPQRGVTCASCVEGVTPAGNPQAGIPGEVTFGGHPSYAIADTGAVFFDTPTSLLPADGNQLADVYGFSPDGRLSLITSGAGDRAARLADVTATGSDVFFYTAEPLVGQDIDDLVDVYDARVGGGLAGQQGAPAPAPCSGDGCRAEGPATAQRPAPAAPAPAEAAAPTFALRTPSAAARRQAARRGRLPVRVRVSGAGKVALRATARVRGRIRTVASSGRTATRAGTLASTLRLSGAARSKLRRTGRLTLTLRATFSPVRGSRSVRVTLTRPTRRGKGGSR